MRQFVKKMGRFASALVRPHPNPLRVSFQEGRGEGIPSGRGEGRARERGVSVTEFAILAPVFFLLIMIIVEGGHVFSTWVIITNEAVRGARYGVVQYGDPARQSTLVSNVQASVKSRIGTTMSTDPAKLAVAVQLDQADPSVTVTVDYMVDIVTPLVQQLLPNPFPVRAVSIMRAE